MAQQFSPYLAMLGQNPEMVSPTLAALNSNVQVPFRASGEGVSRQPAATPQQVASTPIPKQQVPDTTPSPQYSPEPSLEEQMQSLYQENINRRQDRLNTFEDQLQEAQNKDISGFKNMNLNPLANFVDNIWGTNTRQGYKAPTAKDDKEKAINRLNQAIGQESNMLSDDQMAYLKMQLDQDYRNKALRAKQNQKEKTSYPKATQFQAAGYGRRMMDAENNLNDVLNNTDVNITDFMNSLERYEKLPNSVRDPKLNRVLQAQRNFINAKLRDESGAAIAASEFASARRQYFPEWGDTPEVLRQKAENRARAIEQMRLQSGDAWGMFSDKPQLSTSSLQANSPKGNVTVRDKDGSLLSIPKELVEEALSEDGVTLVE